MPAIAIRRVRAGDAAALSNLARRAKAHWGYPAEWLERWREDLTLTPEYLDAHDGFVALDNVVPVGVCMIEVDDDRASLEHVWIAPEYHGQGIGRALVTRALELARERGLSRVNVIADPYAEPFYRRLGAERCGEHPAPMPGAPDRTLPRLTFHLPL